MSQNFTPCRRDGAECVHNLMICNGVNDCPDQSDEEFCDRKQDNARGQNLGP